MTPRLYQEWIEFIVAEADPGKLIAFRPSETVRARAAELVGREKSGATLTPDEAEELAHWAALEQMLSAAKARAQQRVAQQASLPAVQQYEQHERELRQRQEEFDRRHAIDVTLSETKQAHERGLFARMEQASRFRDIQDRFASPDEKTRAAAALRLGALAQESLPGTEPGAPRNEAHYPYFLPAVYALNEGLMAEESARARQVMWEAIGHMAQFARTGQANDDGLLLPLIRRTANANRLTKEAFIDALAEYGSFADLTAPPTVEKPETALSRMVILTAFTNQPDATATCLKNLIAADRYKAHQLVYLARRAAASERTGTGEARKDREKTDALLIEKIEVTAGRLRDTRDALAVCLKALDRSRELPSEDVATDTILAYFEEWRKDPLFPAGGGDLPRVDLNQCFLAGADLFKAHLEGASLEGAHLEGANLGGAYLQGAYLLNSAHLEGAFLGGAHLEGARLDVSHLEGADLHRAHLEGAFLGGAHLEGTSLRGAYLKGASLFRAHLEGANLYWAHLDGAFLGGAHLEGANLGGAGLRGTRLDGIKHGEYTMPDGSVRRTDMTRTNWKEADFSRPTSSDTNDGTGGGARSSLENQEALELKSWLEKEFPYEDQADRKNDKLPEGNEEGA